MPPVFEINGKDHPKDFFPTFENYFAKKYSRNLYDKTQTLSTFLTGDLLTVYEARGSHQLKYENMKELMQFYRKQKIGGKSFWRKEFQNSIAQDGESYDIYGMRLTDWPRRLTLVVRRDVQPNFGKDSYLKCHHLYLRRSLMWRGC